MKTQLIPLETHDDLISVRDRMSWAKTPRILLIWPKSERIKLRPLDLKILQRHAESLGAQLGLVVRHRSIRREAQGLDIPVFNSTGEAQRRPWPERDLQGNRKRRRPRQDLRRLRKQARAEEGAWRSHPVTRVVFFTLGVLAVLASASLFIPRAQIIVTPETETQSVTLPVRANPSLKTVSITGNIPSRELSVIVEDSMEALTSGEVPVPLTKAGGTVTFRNLTENEVSIPLGTVLTSTGLPGARFLTLEQGKLPGGLDETIDVPIEAENPGATGNVEADTILAIEGNLGLLTTVTNGEPTSGGRDRMTEAATETDRVRLRQNLVEEMEKQALAEMERMLAPDDQIFPDTLTAGQVLQETYDPPAGQPGNKVTINLRVEYTASYASGNDLNELAITVLNTSLPEGYIATSKPITFEAREEHTTDSHGVTSWQMRISRELEKRVDSGAIIPLVQGRRLTVVTAQLADHLDLPVSPEIRLTPNWWPWMPLIPLNITVESH